MPSQAKKKRRVNWWRVIVLTALLLGVVVFGTGAGFVLGVLRDAPTLDEIVAPKPTLSSIVYDRNGVPVKVLHGAQNRVAIDIDKVPLHLQEAFLAIEDHQFYQHHGVNPRALLRAGWVILTKHRLEGGSTITQQLAKTAFLSPEQTIRRKLQDMWLAIQLERRFTKKEILGFYLNQIYLGHSAYGVQAAAQIYFGKDLTKDKLTLAEGALLAGMTQSPGDYDPYLHPDAARARRNTVLDKMAEYGYTSGAAAEQAKLEDIKLVGLKKEDPDYPGAYFVDWVVQQLIPKYGERKVYEGGLKIYTTLDLKSQQATEKAVHVLDARFPLKKDAPNVQTAAVFMDAQTGYVRAMVGGRTHPGELVLNRALTPHQPGSAIKPLAVYSLALENGITPGTVFDDAPFTKVINGKVWRPENWNFKYQGLVTVRKALTDSINTVALQVADQLGPNRVFDSAKRFGLTTLVESGPKSDRGNLAFALGGLTEGVMPLELTAAYSTFANGGVRSKPISILKVLDSSGHVLEENEPKHFSVLSPQVNYLMVDMMKSVVREGTGGTANINRPQAGKTGSTDDWADVWFMGFTPDIVGGVWVGYDDKRANQAILGGGGFWPHRIWRAAMLEITKGTPATDWKEPSGIVNVAIDSKSGKLPSEWTPRDSIRTELFLAGTEPTTKDDVHVPALVCANDPKLLYTPNCVGEVPVLRVFIKRPHPWTPTPDGRGPADAKDELPTKYCDPHSAMPAGPPPATLPGSPPPPGATLPGTAPGTTLPGSSPPGTTPPGTTPPGSTPPGGTTPAIQPTS